LKLTNKYGFKSVYCKKTIDNFTIGKQYEIHNIQLINSDELLFVVVADDDFPYQFYTIGTSKLFYDFFTSDIKKIRKLKLNEINEKK